MESGYPIALYGMASRQDTPPDQAMVLLRRANEAGVILAARAISKLYAGGKAIAKDMPEALRWLKLGADEGDPFANIDLGRMYLGGDDSYGIAQDSEKALFHFTLAVRLLEERGRGDSAEIQQPMLYRSTIAGSLPTDKVAEIWDRAHSWKPGDTPATPISQKSAAVGVAVH